MAQTLYQALGVGPTATVAEIKKAYRKLALLHHPDKTDSPESHELFQRANDAHTTLTDEVQRRKYDLSLRASTVRVSVPHATPNPRQAANFTPSSQYGQRAPPRPYNVNVPPQGKEPLHTHHKGRKQRQPNFTPEEYPDRYRPSAFEEAFQAQSNGQPSTFNDFVNSASFAGYRPKPQKESTRTGSGFQRADPPQNHHTYHFTPNEEPNVNKPEPRSTTFEDSAKSHRSSTLPKSWAKAHVNFRNYQSNVGDAQQSSAQQKEQIHEQHKQTPTPPQINTQQGQTPTSEPFRFNCTTFPLNSKPSPTNLGRHRRKGSRSLSKPAAIVDIERQQGIDPSITAFYASIGEKVPEPMTTTGTAPVLNDGDRKGVGKEQRETRTGQARLASEEKDLKGVKFARVSEVRGRKYETDTSSADESDSDEMYSAEGDDQNGTVSPQQAPFVPPSDQSQQDPQRQPPSQFQYQQPQTQPQPSQPSQLHSTRYRDLLLQQQYGCPQEHHSKQSQYQHHNDFQQQSTRYQASSQRPSQQPFPPQHQSNIELHVEQPQFRHQSPNPRVPIELHVPQQPRFSHQQSQKQASPMHEKQSPQMAESQQTPLQHVPPSYHSQETRKLDRSPQQPQGQVPNAATEPVSIASGSSSSSPSRQPPQTSRVSPRASSSKPSTAPYSSAPNSHHTARSTSPVKRPLETDEDFPTMSELKKTTPLTQTNGNFDLGDLKNTTPLTQTNGNFDLGDLKHTTPLTQTNGDFKMDGLKKMLPESGPLKRRKLAEIVLDDHAADSDRMDIEEDDNEPIIIDDTEDEMDIQIQTTQKKNVEVKREHAMNQKKAEAENAPARHDEEVTLTADEGSSLPENGQTSLSADETPATSESTPAYDESATKSSHATYRPKLTMEFFGLDDDDLDDDDCIYEPPPVPEFPDGISLTDDVSWNEYCKSFHEATEGAKLLKAEILKESQTINAAIQRISVDPYRPENVEVYTAVLRKNVQNSDVISKFDVSIFEYHKRFQANLSARRKLLAKAGVTRRKNEVKYTRK